MKRQEQSARTGGILGMIAAGIIAIMLISMHDMGILSGLVTIMICLGVGYLAGTAIGGAATIPKN